MPNKRTRRPASARRHGSQVSFLSLPPVIQPSRNLETFDNPEPGRDYTVRIDIPEFTCLCPLTSQPDFAHLLIEYVPDLLCLELKSLKGYIWSFRNIGAFHETVTNDILGDLCKALSPRFMRLTARFNMRGGIATAVTAEHRKPGWEADAPVTLPDRD